MKWAWKVLCVAITDSLVLKRVSAAHVWCAMVQTIIVVGCWLVGFYGISTFVGYLMPNPFLC